MRRRLHSVSLVPARATVPAPPKCTPLDARLDQIWRQTPRPLKVAVAALLVGPAKRAARIRGVVLILLPLLGSTI